MEVPLLLDVGEERSSHDGDSKPLEEQRSRSAAAVRRVIPFIIVPEFCERLAYYGLAGSLVLFLQTRLQYSNGEADSAYALWSGVCYATPLIGALLADSLFGRCATIAFSGALYLIGLICTATAALPGNTQKASAALLFLGLYLIALATGGIKPNVSTFGADQFSATDPKQQQDKQFFFSLFYASVNLGAVGSFTLISYVCQYGLSWAGGSAWGFGVGFFICSAAMLIAMVVFGLGTPWYRRVPVGDSQINKITGIVWQAVSRSMLARTGGRALCALDRSKTSHGGSYSDSDVEDVRQLLQLVRFLAFTVPFWAIYSQMSTSFQNQACSMDLRVGSVSIPVSALNCFDTLSILLLIPAFEKILYPMLAKLRQKTGTAQPSRLLPRIAWGYVFAALAMLTAAGVEIRRKQLIQSEAPISLCLNAEDFDPHYFSVHFRDTANSHCRQIPGCDFTDEQGHLALYCITCDEPQRASSMSVLWQIFQFMFIGCAEVLLVISTMDFVYTESPVKLRSLGSAFNLLCTALGSWSIIPLIKIVNSNSDRSKYWVPDDVNQGHLERYLFLLAGIAVVTLGLYTLWMSKYRM